MAPCSTVEQPQTEIIMRLTGWLKFMAQPMEYPDPFWLTHDHR